MSRFLDSSDYGDQIPATRGDRAYEEEPVEEPLEHSHAADDDDDDYELAVELSEYPDDSPSGHHRTWVKSVLAIVLSLAVLTGAGIFVYVKAKEGFLSFIQVQDYSGPGGNPVTVEIPADATLTDMAEILVDADVVESKRAFIKASRQVTGASNIQPGTYQLRTKMSGSDAVQALLDRKNMVVSKISIRAGMRNTAIVSALSEQSGLPESDFNAVLANSSSLPLPEWAKGATEGFMFPDVYVFESEPDAQTILTDMAKHFTATTQSMGFADKATALGITPYEAVTIASIIEKESGSPKDDRDIAQVLYNRLKKGMRLQLDSTALYAANSSGSFTTTDEQRQNPSPYNTYMNDGLPPGAISNPSKTALMAAVDPTEGDYLYFVAVNPDTHETKFASDEQGHAANVAEFQSWCQANSDRCG